jgi:hypothetical protein
MTKLAGSGSGSRSISERHGSGTLVVHTKLYDGFDLIRIKSPFLSMSDLSMSAGSHPPKKLTNFRIRPHPGSTVSLCLSLSVSSVSDLSMTMACWPTLSGYSVMMRLMSCSSTPNSLPSRTQSPPNRFEMSETRRSARWIVSNFPP